MRKSILTGAAFLLLFSLSVGPAFAGTSGGAAWYNVVRCRNNLAVRGVFATMTCPRGNARGTIRQNWVGVGTYGAGGGSVGWEIDPQGSLYARWTGGNGVGVLMPLGLIKDGRPTMLGVSIGQAEGRRPMRKLYVGILCHETVWEMRVGPSEPACRDRLQTTVSGVSKELGSLASRKRQTRDSVR